MDPDWDKDIINIGAHIRYKLTSDTVTQYIFHVHARPLLHPHLIAGGQMNSPTPCSSLP